MEDQGSDSSAPQPDNQTNNVQESSTSPGQPVQPAGQASTTPDSANPAVVASPPATDFESSQATETPKNPSTPHPSTPLSEWPGAFKVYKVAKEATKVNTNTLVGLAAIVIASVIVYIGIAIATGQSMGLILRLVYDVISALLSGALIYAILQSAKGQAISIGEAYSVALKKWAFLIISSILVGIMCAISLLLFIIPFFFVFPRLFLVNYYILDKNMNPLEAIEASWEHTKGNVGKVYGIVGVYILIILPSITIIGVIATLYFGFMYLPASALLYQYILNKQSGGGAALPTANTPAVNPAPPVSS